MIKNKGGFEMSFSVIFAIIAGAVILFLAIYATTSLIKGGQETTYTEAAKSIDNYLGDLVTGISEGVSTKIIFKKETRILFDCSYSSESTSSPFGQQTIGFSEESGIGERWYESKTKITRKNKYIFANNTEQGKKMFIFIKPFYMGFKVDDLIIMSSNQYCFVKNSMPNRIIEDLENLNMENVNLVDSLNVCGNKNVTVCFGNGNCDVNVYSDSCLGCDEYEVGRVEKDGDSADYVGNLLYGAIFSSPEIYKCNLARLGKKTAVLSELYLGKIDEVSSKNCNSVIGPYLQVLSNGFNEENVKSQYRVVKEMDSENEIAVCKIYPGETYGNV
jgi:hypothetical protein